MQWKLSFFCSFLGSGLGEALGFVVLLLCFSALDSSWLCGPPRYVRDELLPETRLRGQCSAGEGFVPIPCPVLRSLDPSAPTLSPFSVKSPTNEEKK